MTTTIGTTTANTAPHLLPTGSTRIEQAVDSALPRFEGLVQALHPLSSQHPEPFKPWLAAEWQLAQFASQFATLDALIDNGLPWLIERGSAASVLRVLQWLGYADGVKIEEEGPYLHIDLGRVASAQELEPVARLVRASIPLHVDFYRVYHGWDLRALRLDGGQRLDKALLDTDSGGWVDTSTGPLKASFASWYRVTLPPREQGHNLQPVVSAAHHRTTVLDPRSAGEAYWDNTTWGDTFWSPIADGMAAHHRAAVLGLRAAGPVQSAGLETTTTVLAAYRAPALGPALRSEARTAMLGSRTKAPKGWDTGIWTAEPWTDSITGRASELRA
jgi:hypothetical protein